MRFETSSGFDLAQLMLKCLNDHLKIIKEERMRMKEQFGQGAGWKNASETSVFMSAQSILIKSFGFVCRA